MSSIIIIPHARLFFYVPFLFPRPRLIMDFLPIFIYAWFFENRVSKDEDSFYYLAIKNNENLAKWNENINTILDDADCKS